MSTPFAVPKEELKSPSQRTPGALLKFDCIIAVQEFDAE